nr:MAG TPA: replicative helicase [Bacteriophage sp.]
MINIGEFLTGVKEKYPAILLKGRLEAEGNVVSCFFKDMLLLDDTTFESDDFITSDGRFYYGLVSNLRKKGFYSLDEITILSNLSSEALERYEANGGWETIQHQIDIINVQNFDTYIDILYRENIILKLHDDGFNLSQKIDFNGKEIIPIKLFRKMTAEEVTDWYEARISSYGTGYSSKILEEEEIDFDDEFIESCEEGEENGVPFDIAGYDKNGEEINCFPFLSRQVMGLLEGTFTMVGGFSSVGKSTYYITILMALLFYERKILIISNEESIKKFKVKFMIWLLAKRNRYFKLTKKKLSTGDIDPESRAQLTDVQKFWRENYKGKVKFISINDANMGVIKKKIRENVLRHGYDTVLYDTFKIQEGDFSNSRQDLALVRDSRELDKLAKKYNLIMLASVQLAEYMKGKLFLDASCLSNAKQIKEILENLFLMRTVYDEELDEKSKYYCHPFRLKKVNGKWIEEEYKPDRSAVWRALFVEKCRSGSNSSDTGVGYLIKYSGDHCIFREVAQARFKHGEIK